MQLHHCVKVSYEAGCYVLDGCLTSDQSLMAFTTSTNKIRCYDARTTTHLFEIGDHNAPITDIVTAPLAHPNLLFSCQSNTGVMVTDIREGKAIHFLTEMMTSGRTSSSLSVSADGVTLALATDGSVELVDTRTWSSARCLSEIHTDEITRVRFCGSSTLCTAGEDQMLNVIDLAQPEEDDMMLNIMNVGEVITRMNYFSSEEVPSVVADFYQRRAAALAASGEGGQPAPLGPGGIVTAVGTCENCFVVPLLDGAFESKIERPNFETYQVDFVAWQGHLGHITGSKDDDGNAGPLAFDVLPRDGSEATSSASLLSGAHQEIARVALTAGSTSLITGGEDGMIAYWRPSAVSGADGETESAASSMKQRSNAGRDTRRAAGRPY